MVKCALHNHTKFGNKINTLPCNHTLDGGLFFSYIWQITCTI